MSVFATQEPIRKPVQEVTRTPTKVSRETVKFQTFKVGGVPVNIPLPDNDMMEIGYDYKKIVEEYVADERIRFMAVYIDKDDFMKIKQGEDVLLSKSADIIVERSSEYKEFTSKKFKTKINELDKQIVSLKKAKKEVSSRIESFYSGETMINWDEYVYLGEFFSKKNAYGDGMISHHVIDGYVYKYVTGGAIVRVNNKEIFIYYSTIYENAEDVTEVKRELEEWADCILKAN